MLVVGVEKSDRKIRVKKWIFVDFLGVACVMRIWATKVSAGNLMVALVEISSKIRGFGNFSDIF